MNNQKFVRNIKGFTLMEAVLTIALGALIMAALTTVFQVGKKSWTISSRQNELLQHARVALSRLSTELRYVTSLNQADTSVIDFDTNVLLDSDDSTTETIHYDLSFGALHRTIVGTGQQYIVAGDQTTGGVVAQLVTVQPVKLDASNNVVPLAVSDPLSLAKGMILQLSMSQDANTVEVETLVHFRGK